MRCQTRSTDDENADPVACVCCGPKRSWVQVGRLHCAVLRAQEVHKQKRKTVGELSVAACPLNVDQPYNKAHVHR